MFFEALRKALRDFEEGVHIEGAPASPAAIVEAEQRLGGLPPRWRELAASWDGLRLFGDTYELSPLAALTREGALWVVGVTPSGRICMDGGGRVFEADDDGEPVLAGRDLDRWLTLIAAREAMLVDAQGEYRDVLDEHNELKTEVRRRRLRAATRGADPETAWRLESAELALEAGRAAEAETELAAAVAAEPTAGAAWALYAGVLARRGAAAEALAAWVSAAEHTHGARLRAERWAEAARLAAQLGRSDEAARHGAAGRAVDAGAAAALVDEARALTEGGDLDAALRRAELAAALAAPDDATPAQLAATLRARKKLALSAAE